MKNAFGSLRLTLALVGLGMFVASYISLMNPGLIDAFMPPGFPDRADDILLKVIGALSISLTIGAALAFLQPLKYVGAIVLLIISHFALFIVDLVLLIQGTTIPFYVLVPEMGYFLFVCILMVRYFPVEISAKDLSQTADVLVETMNKNMKKQQKEEEQLRKKIEKEEADKKRELEKEEHKMRKKLEKEMKDKES